MATPRKYSITRVTTSMIVVTDNVTGNRYLFHVYATYLFMEVVKTNQNYRFHFQHDRADQEVVIPIADLNDINGIPPLRNNQATDWNSLINLINPV